MAEVLWGLRSLCAWSTLTAPPTIEGLVEGQRFTRPRKWYWGFESPPSPLICRENVRGNSASEAGF